MSSWSIAVKTVGGQSNGDVAKENFTINVSPDDHLKSLHDQIEEFTGIKASQQRLIYRGRLISGGGDEQGGSNCDTLVQKKEPKVKDVIGLCDGQTIHLVPKPESASSVAETNATEVPSSSSSSGSDGPSGSSSGSAAILAALLGLSTGDDDDPSDDSTSLGQQLQRLRSARIRNRNRRTNYRLTHSDITVPDPGSMEPVRQGLMTLHTLLAADSSPGEESLSNHRQWYRGQWIDCRDTVNQWLEATIVDIVDPEQILPRQFQGEDSDPAAGSRRQVVEPTSDPAVSANDLEGRIRLLLEPADSYPFENEWGGFRLRDSNEGVHLLLIHYNGWPHRWDEWIRSDSERIRPFRTRTRHNNSSPTSCPTPQSTFGAAPSTCITGSNETTERSVLVPELLSVMTQINRLAQTAGSGIDQPSGVDPSDSEREGRLPWVCGASSMGQDLPTESAEGTSKPDLRRQLTALAPLLDRLGRTLVDAAPHVASYASTLPSRDPGLAATREGDSPNVVIANDLTDVSRSEEFSLQQPPTSSEGGNSWDEGVMVLAAEMEPDYIDFVHGMVNTSRGETRSRVNRAGGQDEGASLLGAYLAAASLSSLISDDDNNADNGSGGLQGLGRLFRQRETNGADGNGGGIDIHIHAIVTGPGVGTGGGLAVLGEPQVPTARPSLSLSGGNRRFSAPERPPPPQNEEEDMGIFDDLYSENPSPVDLRRGVLPSQDNRRGNASESSPSEDNVVVSELGDLVSGAGSSRSRSGPAESTNDVRPRSREPQPSGGSPVPRRGVFSRMFRRGRRSNASQDNLS